MTDSYHPPSPNETADLTTEPTPATTSYSYDLPNTDTQGNITQQNPPPSIKKNNWVKVFIISVLKLILFLIAGKLSWQCNYDCGLLVKIVMTSISVLFSEIYIIYYAIYHITLGNIC
jgi:hypothetical protein